MLLPYNHIIDTIFIIQKSQHVTSTIIKKGCEFCIIKNKYFLFSLIYTMQRVLKEQDKKNNKEASLVSIKCTYYKGFFFLYFYLNNLKKKKKQKQKMLSLSSCTYVSRMDKKYNRLYLKRIWRQS